MSQLFVVYIHYCVVNYIICVLYTNLQFVLYKKHIHVLMFIAF